MILRNCLGPLISVSEHEQEDRTLLYRDPSLLAVPCSRYEDKPGAAATAIANRRCICTVSLFEPHQVMSTLVGLGCFSRPGSFDSPAIAL